MIPIDINEAHHILLDIAKAFVSVCEKNTIPYYMLGGTMLGAIRHNGFIPWDDDMDFGVPRKYYDALIKLLEEQLPPHYRCCTFRNGLAPSVIVKIDDSRTIINSIHNKENHIPPLGLNIDVFPLDYCAPNAWVMIQESILTFIYRAKYAKNPRWSKIHILLNRIVDMIIPWSRIELNEKKEDLLKNLRPGPYLSNVFGAWGARECIPVEWYGEGTMFRFDDTMFCGIKEYDNYLRQLYGDYMIPSIKDKHIHLNGVYWK